MVGTFLFQDYPVLTLSILCISLLSTFSILSSRLLSRQVIVNWPVVGMLPAVFAQFHRLHDFVTDALRYSSLTWMFKGPWFLGMEFLVTCDPANVLHIFTSNFPNYPKGPDFSEAFDVLGAALFGADGNSWSVQRKMAQAFIADRAFRSSTLAATRCKVELGLLPLLGEVAATGQTFDLENLFSRLTFDITSVMVFGYDSATLSVSTPNNPFAEAIDHFWECVVVRQAIPKSWWKLLRRLNLGTERKMARANVVINQFIADKMTLGQQPKGLLAYYTSQPFEEVKDFFHSQDKFIRDSVLFSMIAGRDAFAITLSWLFWLLCKNPDVEAKLLRELQDYHHVEEIGSMVYLHGAVCETLRLYPPVPIEQKSALAADELPSGHRLEAGTTVLVSVYAMGRTEEIWGEDCLEFKPERWITKEGKLRHVPAYKFMSFNSGQRSCLGKEIGLTQLKMVTTAMLYNFEVELVGGHVVKPKSSGMIRMQNGMRVTVRKRIF